MHHGLVKTDFLKEANLERNYKHGFLKSKGNSHSHSNNNMIKTDRNKGDL